MKIGLESQKKSSKRKEEIPLPDHNDIKGLKATVFFVTSDHCS